MKAVAFHEICDICIDTAPDSEVTDAIVHLTANATCATYGAAIVC